MKTARDWLMAEGQKKIIFFIVSSAVVSLALAWISTGFVSVQGWQSFLVVLSVSNLLLLGMWNFIKLEKPPNWLWASLITAATLRLALGVVWLLALPAWGYDTPVQNAGYIMADAYDRDNAAWQLSQSELPLSVAFQNYSSTDQYGGLLYVSAFIYRFLGSTTHQPLLIIILTAALSSGSVLFAWAITKNIWGQKVAKIAAWALALYPEAVLLGS
ncbi:MAG: hypothetical protein N2D54_09745, partial [Chloroflexota bacterium]